MIEIDSVDRFVFKGFLPSSDLLGRESISLGHGPTKAADQSELSTWDQPESRENSRPPRQVRAFDLTAAGGKAVYLLTNRLSVVPYSKRHLGDIYAWTWEGEKVWYYIRG